MKTAEQTDSGADRRVPRVCWRTVTWALVLAAAALTACAGPEDVTLPDRERVPEDPVWSTPPEQELPGETADALQTALETYLETQDAPGATAAVVTTEGTWAGASGVDGVGAQLEPRSAFAIASITKTFVAAEVMLLSSRGQVELDGAVADHVELPFDTGGATVREVLGMASGFPQDPNAQIASATDDDLDREWTVDEVFDLTIPGVRQGTRGGEPNYNNLNYYALGAMIEEVTGDPLAVALRQDLIDPAGLDRVWVQTAEEPTPPLAIAVSDPRGPAVDVDGPYLPSLTIASFSGAAGGMVADAPSLARWGHLLYGGEVIDTSLVKQMTESEDDRDWYGLGTALFNPDGEAVVGHDGYIGVYHSLMAVWPASATSVAILVPAAPSTTLNEDRTALGLARALHQAAAD